MIFDKKMKKYLKGVGIVIGVIYLISGIIIWRYYHRDQEPIPEFKGWLFYWDGPYKGKVIDLDTGEPIEGAVIAGNWHLEVFPGWPKFCDAVETTSDKNGEFVLPRACCASLWPIGMMSLPGDIVVFKPGYLGYPPLGSNENERIFHMPDWEHEQFFKDTRLYNIIKLGRPETRQEREFTLWDAEDILNSFDSYKRLPMLLELADKEHEALGRGEIPYKKGERK